MGSSSESNVEPVDTNEEAETDLEIDDSMNKSTSSKGEDWQSESPSPIIVENKDKNRNECDKSEITRLWGREREVMQQRKG